MALIAARLNAGVILAVNVVIGLHYPLPLVPYGFCGR